MLSVGGSDVCRHGFPASRRWYTGCSDECSVRSAEAYFYFRVVGGGVRNSYLHRSCRTSTEVHVGVAGVVIVLYVGYLALVAVCSRCDIHAAERVEVLSLNGRVGIFLYGLDTQRSVEGSRYGCGVAERLVGEALVVAVSVCFSVRHPIFVRFCEPCR